MSHTYKDRDTGVVFIYNSDLSGDVEITLPTGERVQVPGDALSNFWAAVFNTEDVREGLMNIMEWLRKHDNGARRPEPTAPPPVLSNQRLTLVLHLRHELLLANLLPLFSHSIRAMDDGGLARKLHIVAAEEHVHGDGVEWGVKSFEFKPPRGDDSDHELLLTNADNGMQRYCYGVHVARVDAEDPSRASIGGYARVELVADGFVVVKPPRAAELWQATKPFEPFEAV